MNQWPSHPDPDPNSNGWQPTQWQPAAEQGSQPSWRAAPTEQTSRPALIIVLALAVIAALTIAVTAIIFAIKGLAGNQTQEPPQPTSSPVAPPSVSSSPTPTPVVDGGLPAGSYAVGTDIDPGVYYLHADAEDADITLTSADAVDWERSFDRSLIAEFAAGDEFVLTDARLFPIDEAPDRDSSTLRGAYRVGIDIPAGEYVVVPEHDYGVEIYTSTSVRWPGNTFPNRYFYSDSGFAALTAEDGDIVVVNRGTGYLYDDAQPLTAGPSGIYKVGRDIPAGDFVVRGADSDQGYVMYVWDDGRAMETVAFKAALNGGPAHVSLSEGQYVDLDQVLFEDPASQPVPDLDAANGELVVGEDLPAGQYAVVFEGDDPFTMTLTSCRGRPTAYETAGIQCAKHRRTQFNYIDVEDGDFVFVDGVARVAPLSQAPHNTGTTGMFLVGRDIPAGTYTIALDDDGDASFDVLASAGPDPVDSQRFSQLETDTEVTVRDGEYLVVKRGELQR